jgi:hypothetical protein
VRLLSNICEERLISDCLQFGFRSNVGCSDANFTIRTVISHFNSWGITVYLAALDIKKAFDSVRHDKLFDMLLKAGIPNVVVEILRNCTVSENGGKFHFKWWSCIYILNVEYSTSRGGWTNSTL